MKRADELVPLGVLEEQVLVAVIRTQRDTYGMNVRREIERVTGREVAIGAVYATLDRLEAKGLLTSRRVAGGDVSRRCFVLTSAGTKALSETYMMRQRLWEGIDPRRLGLA